MHSHFQIIFEVATWGFEKIWEGGVLYFRVLLHFYDLIFQNLVKGYILPPLSHLSYDWKGEHLEMLNLIKQ
jgi:hypothetical protein